MADSEASYRVDVRRPIDFLWATIQAFQEKGAIYLAIEGDLSKVPWSHVEQVVGHGLRPVCIASDALMMFTVLQLGRGGASEVFRKSVLPTIGIRSRIVHVRIFLDGHCVMAAYDQWDPDCTVVSGLNEKLLTALKDDGVLRDFVRCEDPA